MKVLIIEDEAPAFRRLQNLIDEIDSSIEIIDVIDSVDDSVKWFRSHNPPDLIFMDIQLADGLSFEIFDQVKIQSPVIFTTAFDEYTLRAFKVNSIDYLLKPIAKEELTNSLQKWREMRLMFEGDDSAMAEIIKRIKTSEPEYKKRFLVKMGERLISVEDRDIAYFVTRESLVYLITKEGKKYFLDQTLDDLENIIDPREYYRLNRQFLVHISSIQGIHQYFKGKLKIDLNPLVEEEVTVSREKATSFKKWLDR